ncbi:MAG: hypothetical protein AB1938_13825 [Myxococcota bacterium]
MRSPGQALEMVRRRGVVRMSDVVNVLAGEAVKGSWWAHPRGKFIFNVLSALEDGGRVGFLKLDGERVWLVHLRLFPHVVRVAMDEARRAEALEGLSPVARRLLQDVEARGEVRVDRWTGTKDPTARKKARVALEARLLVHSASEHTESGAHATVLRTWARWAGPEVLRAAKALSLADARRALKL